MDVLDRVWQSIVAHSEALQFPAAAVDHDGVRLAIAVIPIRRFAQVKLHGHVRLAARREGIPRAARLLRQGQPQLLIQRDILAVKR